MTETFSIRCAVHPVTGALIVHAHDYADYLRLIYALDRRRSFALRQGGHPPELPEMVLRTLVRAGLRLPDSGPPAFASIGADS